jgi:hypothetical protein
MQFLKQPEKASKEKDIRGPPSTDMVKERKVELYDL